jgi:hypothetical protein
VSDFLADVANSPQVFFLLVLEMALFMLLLIPLPYTAKRKVFS